MKYFVIIKKWDDEKKAVVNEIAGAFEKYYNAALFRDAYNANFNADAKVVEQFDLLNQR